MFNLWMCLKFAGEPLAPKIFLYLILILCQACAAISVYEKNNIGL